MHFHVSVAMSPWAQPDPHQKGRDGLYLLKLCHAHFVVALQIRQHHAHLVGSIHSRSLSDAVDHHLQHTARLVADEAPFLLALVALVDEMPACTARYIHYTFKGLPVSAHQVLGFKVVCRKVEQGAEHTRVRVLVCLHCTFAGQVAYKIVCLLMRKHTWLEADSMQEDTQQWSTGRTREQEMLCGYMAKK